MLPINAGAAALALLAGVPDCELDDLLANPLARFTDATDADKLGERLDDIRQ